MTDLIPKLWVCDEDVDYFAPSETATTVVEEEKSRYTGLVDQYENPILKPKFKVGF